ncbi:cysteine-rich motor neuron 1 protein-like isoform X1 [Haliotis rufescens]|uniref:cysteine-rich motor neuron 1 protein-like isoform X1 n=1 Tax=Haliotis rufescens TaxID=6454 RepID=UPI00201F772B|nr:cysteine-rich motor neuron 1 protein-like isoform X1 [Haliotis rufescens]
MDVLLQACLLCLLCTTLVAPARSMMFGGCPGFMCGKNCPSGYKRDMMGCKLCQCKTPPVVNRPILLVPVVCREPNCSMLCADGYVRDSRGCLTCMCKPASSSVMGVMSPMNTGSGSGSGSSSSGSGFLSIPCPKGVSKVNCNMPPCLGAKCRMYPMATCVESYCGGCRYAFYVNKKKVSC